VNEPAGWGVTADPSSRRCGELFEEQAILHGPDSEEAWFIRGNIDIPVHDGTWLTYTVWLSVSQRSYERAHQLWLDERRVHEQPYFAWLWADLPGYPPTRELKTLLHTRPPGQRRTDRETPRRPARDRDLTGASRTRDCRAPNNVGFGPEGRTRTGHL
jgi:hypothetical protein